MKTIEQAATNAYIIEVLSSGCNAGVTFGKEMFKQGVEFAQRFIPMSEELPPNHTKILVIDSISNSVSYGQFSQNMEWFHCHKSTNVFAKSDIIGWRPISFL